ncbi:hypothetical protein C8A05DRAFT_16387 [Staphylotrichum tortipilum]|uniref:Protein kinase domain-containing protein n=1 Tax=Staphylotrichum tortipilum TaxID=2831512 RepID=A0AAN6MKA8_9PEZI|nr:hypothetical protein C8A05DRAFT_16387 [Staphylotrichum longicolle]
MLSFSRPGCVKTGVEGCVFAFGSTTGESYLFIRDLADGAQSTAQLVVDLATNETVVRKVSRHKKPLDSAQDLTKMRPDREARILAHLNDIIRNPTEPLPESFTPRWTTCISQEDLPVLSSGPNPKLECTRVSYWKLCNSGTLGDWLWGYGPDWMPVSMVARCIAQVSETLHVMYTAGPECIFHCDLHLHNVFVHFDSGSPWALPDFYLGDFGLARTASETKAESEAIYGDGDIAALLDSPPPGAAQLNHRRRWDMARFFSTLSDAVRFPIPDIGSVLAPPAPPTPPSPGKEPLVMTKQETGLQRLLMIIKFIDSQDQLLAAQNPRSRPPSLVEVVREAKKLESAALIEEQGSKKFELFMAPTREKAKGMAKGDPFIFTGGQGLAPGGRKALAAKYGDAKIEGPWTVMECE